MQRPRDPLSMMKIGTVIDLPSIVLVEKLFMNGYRQVYFPVPLLEMWIRSIQPPHESPSGQVFLSPLMHIFFEEMNYN